MIKFYQYIKDCAKHKNISPITLTKRIDNWEIELIRIPKGMKFYELDKEAIVKEYILSLTK